MNLHLQDSASHPQCCRQVHITAHHGMCIHKYFKLGAYIPNSNVVKAEFASVARYNHVKAVGVEQGNSEEEEGLAWKAPVVRVLVLL